MDARQSGLLPGSAVEIMNRFERRWSHGFGVVDKVVGGYKVRRRSDGWTLPVVFAEADVRLDAALLAV
ncbi:MAG TPA: hypothetical protein VGO92_09345 [Acidimicrobiales bacterium]|jgi:hypothetical protein|nr:hypothetical protein [Acidimicrobiales bacterium]